MFYAMVYFPSFDDLVCVRSLRIKGYPSVESARKAIEKRKLEGYVKQLNNPVPVWSNVQ